MMLVESGFWSQTIAIRKVIFKRFAGNDTAHTLVYVLAPEDDPDAEGIAGVILCEAQGALVSHAKGAQNFQSGRQLYVFVILLETRNGWRADICERRQLLLRQF